MNIKTEEIIERSTVLFRVIETSMDELKEVLTGIDDDLKPKMQAYCISMYQMAKDLGKKLSTYEHLVSDLELEHFDHNLNEMSELIESINESTKQINSMDQLREAS